MKNISYIEGAIHVKRYTLTERRCSAIVDVYTKMVDGMEHYFYTADVSHTRDIITMDMELVCRNVNHLQIASRYSSTKDQLEMVEEKEPFSHQITWILRSLQDHEECPY